MTRDFCRDEIRRERGRGPAAEGTREGLGEAIRICEASDDTRDAAEAMDRLALAYRKEAKPGRLKRSWQDWLDGKAHGLEVAAVHARRMFNAGERF